MQTRLLRAFSSWNLKASKLVVLKFLWPWLSHTGFFFFPLISREICFSLWTLTLPLLTCTSAWLHLLNNLLTKVIRLLWGPCWVSGLNKPSSLSLSSYTTCSNALTTLVASSGLPEVCQHPSFVGGPAGCNIPDVARWLSSFKRKKKKKTKILTLFIELQFSLLSFSLI